MYITHLPTGKRFQKIPETLTIMSIDPGTVNLAIRIEKRTPGRIETFFSEVLNIKHSEFYETLTYLLNMLNDLNKIIMKCHIIVIEQQISKLNPPATRIFERLLTYFTLKLSSSLLNPIIFEIDTKAVKQFFNIPKGKNKGVKDYVGICSEEILERGGELKELEKLRLLPKSLRNHIDDAITQIEVICHKEDLYTILKPRHLEKLSKKWKKLEK